MDSSPAIRPDVDEPDDGSDAVRPEASTVHRPAPDRPAPDKLAPVESDIPNSDAIPSALEPAVAAHRPDAEISRADTVIRSDSRRGLPNPDAVEPQRGSSRSVHGSSAPPLPRNQTPATLTQSLEGQRLNHFELLEQIGGGGMGAVFRARDEQLGRIVAVKVIPFAADDPDLQRRFRNEAQSAAKLDHPLIARVFEVGNDGPWYYIVFEYIGGGNIRDLVTHNGPLSYDEAVFYTCQLAEALGHASKRGIVHRDIKPSNVIVTDDGSIKLVDMGLARSDTFDTSEDMTASGVTLGTFDYISPEQAHDPRLADLRSDLYSLGCTFFFMLTGSPPFPGGTMLQKLLSHGNATIPDICDHRDDVGADLSAILRKMLAKQPDQRYQTTSALVGDLRELAFRENLPRSLGVVAAPVEQQGTTFRLLRRHLPWIVAASLLLLSAAWLELLSWQERREFSLSVSSSVSPGAIETMPPVAPSSNDNAQPPSQEIGSSASTNSEALGQANGSANAVNDSSSGAYVGPDRALGGPERGTVDGSQERQSSDATISQADPRVANAAQDPMLDSLTENTLDTRSADPVNDAQADQAMPLGSSGKGRASDPPSLSGFPTPLDSNVGSSALATDDRQNDLVSESPSLSSTQLGTPGLSPLTGVPRTQPFPGGPATTFLPSSDAFESASPNDPILEPLMIRIVGREEMNDSRWLEQAARERVLPVASLGEALYEADANELDRIDIATPLLISDPLVVTQNDLIISSSVPGGTAIVFRSANEVDMQRSDMLTVGSNRIELVDLHLYWSVPPTETDGGALIALNDNRQVRLTDCSLTVDNPSRRDEIHAFSVVTDPERLAGRDVRNGTGVADSSTLDSLDPMPLVSIELYNVIVRGQITMLKMDVAAELQLLWENGLLAVTRRMIETGGALVRSQPKSGSIRLSLERLTAFIPQGLLQMRLGVSAAYPVAIERRAEESVFVVDQGIPHVEISTVPRMDLGTDWLRLRGSSNAYETDTTLSDPLLLVRDVDGQSEVTTMNDLVSDPPDWADDRTPRWVVRWSQPLPDTISASQLIPADFRQDGSLVGGFQERSLPRMPMERTFDFAPPQ